MMRPSSVTTLFATLTALAVVLGGCAAEDTEDRQAAGPCAIVDNGTPTTKTPAAAAITSRDIATDPAVATVGYRTTMTPVRSATFSVVTANPVATQAACEVLRDGGSAADALVTAQAVLGLVEPQSSGLGGGGFLLYYDAASGLVQAYDGREVAPAAATEDYLRWISDTDRTEPRPDARASGRSIGVPGIVRMLQEAHGAHGTTAWRDLFTHAVTLADNGFEVSARLAAAIADAAPELKADPRAAEYFLEPDGAPKTAGTRLTNPAYAKTLSTIATDPQAFYSGAIARDIVAAATDTMGGRTPSMMTADDLAGYRVKIREPVCTLYRGRQICGMPPPSSGGMGEAEPGDFGAPTTPAPSTPEHGASQVSIVDARGNAASLTTTVESEFGSFHMVDGFLLNNQLTDFSAEPAGPDDAPVVNRIQPGKRPRSSMAPTLIFEQGQRGQREPLYAVLGSPGGSVIIQFVAKTIVGMLDWRMNPRQAVSMVDFGAANGPETNVGGEHPNVDTSDNGEYDPLVQGLRRLGHQVNLADESSGLSVVVRDGDGLVGGADPRREGLVMGNTR